MASLCGLVHCVFTLFEAALQAAFVSDWSLGPHIEAGLRVGYVSFTGGSLNFQLICSIFRLCCVCIAIHYCKSQTGGFFAYNTIRRLYTEVKDIFSLRAHPVSSEGGNLGDDTDDNISCSFGTMNLGMNPTGAR